MPKYAIERKSRGFLLVVVLAVLMLEVRSAGADGGNTALIHACVQQGNSFVRVVSANEVCRPVETALHWPAQQDVSSPPLAITVNCGAGETVAAALAQGVRTTARLTITLVGTCQESVTIARDAVTLQGSSPGDGLQAPSQTSTVLTVFGQRTILNQLTLTGGVRGLVARQGASFFASNLRIAAASSVGVFVQGASGTLSNSTVENGAQEGVQVTLAGSLVIAGGAVQNNGRTGVQTQTGGQALLVGGGHIRNNGFHGGLAGVGASIEVADGIVEGNGGSGLHAFAGGSVRLAGSTSVVSKNRTGIIAQGGVALVDTGARVASNQTGIGVSTGGSLTLQSGVIVENNTDFGVHLTGGSSMTLEDQVSIRGNGADGVRLRDTSVLVFFPPGVSSQIVNNGGFGIACDPAPAVAQVGGSNFIGTVSGNAAGQITCPTTF